MSQGHSPKVYPPRSLADIVGHQDAVRLIRRRFQTGRHDVPLLLYGLAGVGKETVARCYAKALLCERTSGDRSEPCEVCPACRASEIPGSANLDLYSFDAAEHQEKDYLGSAIREFLDLVPVGRRHVVLIENFDRAAPALVDSLLKLMEVPEEEMGLAPRSFTFLARDLAGVRAAGHSRCDVGHLLPLEVGDIRQLCAIASAAHHFDLPDDEALETLAVGSRGMPGLMEAACAALRGKGRVTPVEIRRSLGIDWGGPLLRYWQSLFESGEAQSAILIDSCVPLCNVATYSRYVFSELLTAIRTEGLGTVGEPALRLADQGLLLCTLQAAEKRIRQSAVSVHEFFNDLSGVILNDDFSDEQGFQEFERLSERVLRRYKKANAPRSFP